MRSGSRQSRPPVRSQKAYLHLLEVDHSSNDGCEHHSSVPATRYHPNTVQPRFGTGTWRRPQNSDTARLAAISATVDRPDCLSISATAHRPELPPCSNRGDCCHHHYVPVALFGLQQCLHQPQLGSGDRYPQPGLHLTPDGPCLVLMTRSKPGWRATCLRQSAALFTVLNRGEALAGPPSGAGAWLVGGGGIKPPAASCPQSCPQSLKARAGGETPPLMRPCCGA
jgi:hypothetical protein